MPVLMILPRPPDDDESSPFADDRDDSIHPSPPSGPEWKIMIVDDEQEVHDITALALRGTSFGGRGISFLSAHSAAEARTALAQNSPIAARYSSTRSARSHSSCRASSFAPSRSKSSSASATPRPRR